MKPSLVNPLKTDRKILTLLSMCSSEENENRREKVIRISLNSVLFAIALNYTISSTVFIWKSDDLEHQLYALSQICAGLIMTYSFISMILSRRNVAAILENLTEFYDEYKDDPSFRFLARANNKCEWLWEIYFKYGMCGFTFVIVLNYIGSMALSLYFDGKLNTENSFRGAKLILPWDQQTSIGYIVEMFINLSIFNTYMIIPGAKILFFVSLCLHHRAFYEMFRHLSRKWEISDDEADHKEHILKLLRLHISAKDLFMQSADVCSYVIAIDLIASTMMVATMVFQIDLKIGHNDFNISILLLPVLAGISNLFLYCYMGKMAIDSFLGISECLYECNWYELPIDLQKYFVLMIQNTQKPIYYHGFGVVRLNLETFCDFLRAIYSYYMIFKNLTLN